MYYGINFKITSIFYTNLLYELFLKILNIQTIMQFRIHFIKAEMVEIDLMHFKYYIENQIILVTGFKSLKVQGLSSLDVHPIEMVEIMKNITVIRTGVGRQTIMTIKLDLKFNSGLIQRLNSETLLTTLGSDKKMDLQLKLTHPLKELKQIYW